MNKIVISSLVGGIVLFVWGVVSHAILPWYNGVWNQLTNEQEIQQTLMKNAPTGGLYYLPYSEDSRGINQTEAFINILPPDQKINPGFQMAIGMVVNILSVFLVILLLNQTKKMSYWEKVASFTLIGLIIGFVSHSYYWNWFGFPTIYFFISVLDIVIGWFLVGLIITHKFFVSNLHENGQYRSNVGL